MSDIVDVIHKLSYEVNPEGLNTAIEKLKTQADGVDRLKEKLKSLNDQFNDPNSSQTQGRTQQAIDKTTKAIEQQTEALKRNFLGNQQLQDSISDEIGLIRQLSEYITQATKERAELTDVSKIQKYTADIKSAQRELAALLQPLNLIGDNPQTGALAALQQRQKIVTATLSTLPKEDIAAANVELGKIKNQIKDLQILGKEPIINIRQTGAIEALNNRLTILKNTLATVPKENIAAVNKEIINTQHELDKIKNTGKDSGILATLFGATGDSASLGKQVLQGALLGVGFGSGIGIISRVVSGLIEYGSALLDTEKITEKAIAANEALAKSFDQVGDKILANIELQNKIGDVAFRDATGIDPSVKGLKDKENLLKAIGIVNGEIFKAEENQFSASQERRAREKKDLEDNKLAPLEKILQAIEAAQRASQGAGLNQKSKENAVTLALKTFPDLAIPDRVALSDEVKKATKEGGDLNKALLSIFYDYANKRADIKNQIDDKDKEISNATVDRERKITEEIRLLNIKLKKDLVDANEKYQQDLLKSQVPTSENIIKSIQLETKYRLDALEKEKELERKKLGTLPQAIINEFSEKATGIKREEQQKQLVQLREYYLQQVKLFEGLQAEILQAKIKSEQQSLKYASPLDASGNLDRQREIADNTLQLQLATNSAKYRQELESLEKEVAERKIILDSGNQKEVQELTEKERQISSIYKEFSQNERDLIAENNIKKLDAYAEYYSKYIKFVKDQEANVALALATQLSATNLGIARDRSPNILNKNDRSRVAGLRSDIELQNDFARSARDAKPAADEGVANADRNAENVNKDTTSSDAEREAATKQQQNAQNKREELDKQENEAEKKTLEDKKGIRLTYFNAIAGYYQSLADTAVKAYNTISASRQRDLDHEISVRTERVDLAFKLAERGNVTALAQEQKALEQAQKQKRAAALKDQEINAALTISNALVAVAKAAAEGGVAAPATIALALAAIGVGFAEAQSLAASQKSEFFTGGFTGDGGKYEKAGTVHKGEFVFNKETTSKHRDYFEAIHKGYDPIPSMALPKMIATTNNNYASKSDFRMLGDKLDLIAGKEVNVSQNVDKSGVHQIVVEQNKAHANKWRNN